MPRRTIDIVVFDLGGVVVRICRSWHEACDRAGVPFHPQAATPECIARRKKISHAYEEGRLACDEFFRSIAQTTEGRYTPDDIRRLHHAWLIDEYPGVLSLIRHLRCRGVRTGVLSNTNHAHWTRLLNHDSSGQFLAPSAVDHPHASHLMGLSKPRPEIYHEFARRVGAAPASILFFDDLPDNVAAADAAGWRAHAIDHTADTASQINAALHAHAVV